MGKIFDLFFEALENEIESKWDNIRCKDVYNLYFDFWEELKMKTGSASGFTGLSEVIVFAILKKLLEIESAKQEQDNKNKYKFKSARYTEETFYLHNSKFAIGRGLQVRAKPNKRTPDISIWKNPPRRLTTEPPDFATEIKIYTAEEALKTVEDAINRLKAIKNAKYTFKGMIIFYYKPSKLNEVENRLRKEEGWLKWVILQGNNENFVEILRDWLELK